MIKQLIVNGETLINVPAEKTVLVELGLTDSEADKAISDHNNEKELQALRERRALFLVEADHLVNIALDNGVDIAPYRQYRQQLRDITQTYTTLKDVVWPQKPSLPQASA
ncbi:Phage tail protein [Vibrio crassostreae]|nr:Phage tail protein [Vibrio crassostreae]